jgi:hypothetical protein
MAISSNLKLLDLITQQNNDLEGWIWVKLGNPPTKATVESICIVVNTDELSKDDEQRLDDELEADGFHATIEPHELFGYIEFMREQNGEIDPTKVIRAFNYYLVNNCWPYP